MCTLHVDFGDFQNLKLKITGCGMSSQAHADAITGRHSCLDIWEQTCPPFVVMSPVASWCPLCQQKA